VITILLSHERSGSHLLGEFLGASNAVHVYDEVCNANAVDPERHEASFFRFQSELIVRQQPKIFVPSYESQMELGKAYFSFLLSRQDRSNIVVDIKYGHVRNFDWFWTPPFKRPLLFDICRVNGIRVIHLYRENVVDAAISAAVAKQTQVWHSWQLADQNATTKVSINVESVVTEAMLLSEQIRWISKVWMPGTQHRAITYEALTAGIPDDPQGILKETAEFVGGTAPESFAPRLRKLARRHEDQLANLDALKIACERAGLGHFLGAGAA
jgi:hypothetical protein